jgi:hypothetical protein
MQQNAGINNSSTTTTIATPTILKQFKTEPTINGSVGVAETLINFLREYKDTIY